jgi:CO dehydrogenase/acetyl-CoA synthase delta subunit
LQAVDVPLVIGGQGDPVKDADVFEIREAFQVNVSISSVTRIWMSTMRKILSRKQVTQSYFTHTDPTWHVNSTDALYDYLAEKTSSWT